MTPFDDPRRLPSVEQFALANRVETPFLREKGFMAGNEITPAGVQALKDDGDARHDDALMRNVVPSITASHMVILKKLIDDVELTDVEWRQARCNDLCSCITRLPGGEMRINNHGRHVYSLASGRTY